MLLAQITDLHVAEGPDGDVAATRAEAAVAWLSRLDPAPSAVVVTGDLAEDGTAASTRRVAAILSALECPVFAIPGNHDGRAELIAALLRSSPAGSCSSTRAWATSRWF